MFAPSRYSQGALIEVNAHSLFSKWFSESGKLVTRLFAKVAIQGACLFLTLLTSQIFYLRDGCAVQITEMVEDNECLVFVLIDEVKVGRTGPVTHARTAYEQSECRRQLTRHSRPPSDSL